MATDNMNDANDLRSIFTKKQRELERLLGEVSLTPDQKKVILTAMEFGHAAAFCSRTCDMNGSYFSADEYEGAYHEMKRVLG